jgi:hypothetical protein
MPVNITPSRAELIGITNLGSAGFSTSTRFSAAQVLSCGAGGIGFGASSSDATAAPELFR